MNTQEIVLLPLIALTLAVIVAIIFRKQLGALLGKAKDLVITPRDRTVTQVIDEEVMNDSKKASPPISDIFISYKREEQPIARKLADALEGQGWSVWWDPKLRAGEHFDDVIEKALNEAKCVIVLWSNLSVKSEYVKAEATEALEQRKLVPIKIESVNLPFRFKRVHTPSLLGWDGSKDLTEFRRLIEDITAIVGAPAEQQSASQPENRLKPSTVIHDKLKDGSTQLLGVEQLKGKLELGTVFRDTLADGSQGPEMVVVPAGTFRMGDIQSTGSNSEKPVHIVGIAKPLAMGRYPITFEDYDRFASATGRPLPNDRGWGRERRPAINVSWHDAVEYTKWLSGQTGKQYRLPTEAEWEYAARAGTETDYWWGNQIGAKMANWARGEPGWVKNRPSTVGSFRPNPFGLYDTAGNVSEWVEDCWHENYEGAPTDGSAWLESDGGNGGLRMIRGGTWGSKPVDLRSSSRMRGSADYRCDFIGFRLAQDID